MPPHGRTVRARDGMFAPVLFRQPRGIRPRRTAFSQRSFGTNGLLWALLRRGSQGEVSCTVRVDQGFCTVQDLLGICTGSRPLLLDPTTASRHGLTDGRYFSLWQLRTAKGQTSSSGGDSRHLEPIWEQPGDRNQQKLTNNAPFP